MIRRAVAWSASDTRACCEGGQRAATLRATKHRF
jgi:hypothetical protein